VCCCLSLELVQTRHLCQAGTAAGACMLLFLFGIGTKKDGNYAKLELLDAGINYVGEADRRKAGSKHVGAGISFNM